ncbi:hypothetical protein GALMADRAFT_230998 [Galerina marginata CBS 339.88]|uniref:Uncharacterized protein n=1 Tax=Galerina marginata (strain CBS 339.88) TaxID=685588 RepID=A0A067SCQ0_GALM3|nr:hypothetical protein GALMADRAFT_230998 [Galerina marginata CBS 339.88]
MSSATQEMSRPHVSNLLYILRRANAHYSQVAAAVRNSLRPTYHARKHARSLKLKVSIEAALKLDPKQISTIPLPVIDRVVSPPPAPQFLMVKKPSRPTLRCDIPQNVHADEVLSCVSAYSNVALTPDLSVKVDAPKVLRGQNVPWRPVTSRWSASTVDEEGEGVNVVYSSDYEEGMDLPRTADEEDIAFSPVGPLPSVTGRSPPRLQVPVDLSRLSWGSDLSSGLSSGTSSRSSSSSSITGPVTPDEEIPKLTISIKRKSIACDIDMEDDSLEKRPKYDRKPWVHPTTKRPMHKMPAPRRF